ncbi:hypothetical protein ABPG75_010783 [Micractinium tetrahymenae]
MRPALFLSVALNVLQLSAGSRLRPQLALREGASVASRADPLAALAAAGGVKFVCEAFTAEQCPSQKHCQLCTRVDGLELCFSPEVAEALPRYVFTCAPTAEEMPAGGGLADPGAPKPCKKMTPEECRQHLDVCALCSAPFLAAKCFDPAAAAFLPAGEGRSHLVSDLT